MPESYALRISSLLLTLQFIAGAGLFAQDEADSQIAGNEQVAEVMRTFAPRGVQSDGSQPTPPEKALDAFKMRSGFEIDLVAHEPAISQPLYLSWDSRGRMWVIQYRQYQFPAGLKIVRYDHHLRAVFDKIPEPPPNHVPGKDRITVFEDTDGDGHYDTHKDVITGLNIASSVAVGRGGIWVLNPPYLLFYPDKDGDDVPDSSPEVHLSGFGMQDTHSVANSLMWGPDGWLYGANGSTTGGTVSSQVTSGITFQGQCIWRYNPSTKVFEIWAEGGGNTFSLEIDSKGRIFCGNNGGNTRGWYMPQGSYSHKNWGKHGPLTNPYAFGFFDSMKLEGDTRRFAQAFLVYEGGLFPKEEFDGSIVAPNAMQNLVWHSKRIPDGSTYRTVDEENLVACEDRWFRPVYSGVGPDGAVYIADWYDTRLSHVSPTDDWHKESGRVYRVRPEGSEPKYVLGDLQQKTDEDLMQLFSHPNKWVRRRSALELGWRTKLPEPTLEKLSEMIQSGSLEALWAIHLAGEFTAERATAWLRNSDPYIRSWTARLLGDQHVSHPGLVELATDESDIQVRSQLAATARRIDSSTGLSIATQLLGYSDDADKHMPLMIWWAIESHAEDWSAIRAFASNPEVWGSTMMRNQIAGRLMQRYASTGTTASLEQCEQLIEIAPDDSAKEQLLIGLNKAFQGRTLPPLPTRLASALHSYQAALGESGIVQSVKQGDALRFEDALGKLKSQQTDIGLRIELASAFGEVKYDAAKSVLLDLASARGTSEPALQRVAIRSLAIFKDEKIAEQLAMRFDNAISAEHSLRDTGCRTLASRKSWALVLLKQVNNWRVKPADIPPDVVQRLRTYTDVEIREAVEKAFGKPSEINSSEKVAEIGRLTQVLSTGQGSAEAGEKHFTKRCASCHRLFGKGQSIAPPLDNYDRGNLKFWLPAIVAPSIEIREGFQSYVALTKDDLIVTGMIAARDQRSITIRTADSQLVVIPAEEIEELRALPTSLMPDDLLNELSDDDLRDLFAYLMQSSQ